ncbi:hypothetical protein NO1_0165 [Candidatus Termititenax aidoneus]|uniref:GmrSD restriction endonucleases N-terminal domain-containing protein n=1 Tax=Termititenax aidoneus TaxID=2218524 RepID=A0A388TAF8_TERA1|nr:hypothetical protein NO1_0165 [Candidatus Termititenax aidoneus]
MAQQNESDKLCRTVSELSGITFVIPAYQRGYRWTSQEVRDLLDDIYNFDIGSQKDHLFYYLQPLVVRKIDENKFEVVDGQQRLTTIFIIIKFAAEEMRSAKCPYCLEYSTRKGSQQYLDNLPVSDEIDDQNIDYYHITKARETIQLWLNEQADKARAILNLYDRMMVHTRFIWYELPDDVDPKIEFRKLNVGKIRLTNAELIKALLLSKDNFKNEPHALLINKRQDEISIAWDGIEQHLQKPEFWSFISKDTRYTTRIDIIFNILAHKYAPPTLNKEDDHFAFLSLYLTINAKSNQAKKAEFVEEIWRKVEAIYDRFCDWYNDPDKYHIIGYLTHSGVSVDRILPAVENVPNSQVVTKLKKLADEMKQYSDIQVLTDLDYESNKRELLRKLLLLFNIATLVCKSEKQDRFPFDLYAEHGWDIEHIHAIKDKLPGTYKDAIDYLEALKEEFEQQLEASDDDDERKKQYADAANSISDFLSKANTTQKDAEDFYTDLGSNYSQIIQEDNNIGNLALLDSQTNREYKNVSFRQKRSEIIAKDSEGRFIPLCTRNVFLKYYSPDAKRLTRWEESEREDYKSQIAKTLQEFFS